MILYVVFLLKDYQYLAAISFDLISPCHFVSCASMFYVNLTLDDYGIHSGVCLDGCDVSAGDWYKLRDICGEYQD